MLDLLFVFLMHGGLAWRARPGACWTFSVERPPLAVVLCLPTEGSSEGTSVLVHSDGDYLWEHSWDPAWAPREVRP